MKEPSNYHAATPPPKSGRPPKQECRNLAMKHADPVSKMLEALLSLHRGEDGAFKQLNTVRWYLKTLPSAKRVKLKNSGRGWFIPDVPPEDLE